ncbi:FAD/NAD(P)-binding protein [Sphingomonas panacisoli]|uniref:FAD/NAD(P)-binding protein n=1 Tax=Sphingomonas panacisoli TaxID=1813879 RepID=UPI001F020C20|nr:FAD/NAD(P)-binding protein [Sphingomonas panacisoli]
MHALLNEASGAFAVTIFEEQSKAGLGTPYRPGWNDPAMLSNIASLEIPPLGETLVDWLRRQPHDRLVARGVDPDAIDERAFYPRLMLGDYFYDRFNAMVAAARQRGACVDVRTRCRVTDIASETDGMLLTIRPRHGAVSEERFDYAVLATGHQWPDDPEVRPGYFLSPWPASALARIPPSSVGIRGSSLTAIDAVVALAVAHGEFIEDGEDGLRYAPAADTDALDITMMSRKGLLPEADFFHPLPYEPLSACTPEAVERLIASGEDDLLDPSFALFKEELANADPAYARKTGLPDLALEDFCERYFADRTETDPFEWARTNLKEAQANQAKRFTVPWRYAILRMHEVMALLVPHLNEVDFQRFTRQFKPIFVDDYATVPHESIKRLLALHGAGKLAIAAIGDGYRIDSRGDESGAVLMLDGERRHFPVFIEATGERPLAAKDFPFPSLRRQGIVRDAEPASSGKAVRGIVIDDEFHPLADDGPADRLFCLSLPFLLGRHPFIQGITSSHEMGEIVGKELAAALFRSGTAQQADEEPV